MKGKDVQDAYAEQTVLCYNRSNNWAEHFCPGEKVTMVSGELAHWRFNREASEFQRCSYASKYGSYRTTYGYVVIDAEGRRNVATATQLRGTWDACQEIANKTRRERLAGEREVRERRAVQAEIRDSIEAFGLDVQGWGFDDGMVTVSGSELLELLRELQSRV